MATTSAEVLNARRLAVHYSTGNNEWNSPAHIVQAAYELLGTIDLDPCSNSHDAPNVPAMFHYTEADNGLILPWEGTVYMNPPYGRTIGKWVQKLIQEYNDAAILEAVALLPARTDTAWFTPLWRFPICFIRGRLRFGSAVNSAPFPSVVVYLGDRTQTFYECFSRYGPIMESYP